MRHLALGLMLLAGVPGTLLGATPAQKCAGAKAKTFGTAVAAQARCRAKARAAGTATDGVCLAKVTAALEIRFARAEKGDTCPGDEPAARSAASECVDAFDGATAGTASCAARKIKAAGTSVAGKSRCARRAALEG